MSRISIIATSTTVTNGFASRRNGGRITGCGGGPNWTWLFIRQREIKIDITIKTCSRLAPIK